MKKIFTFFTILGIIYINPFSSLAQCSAIITGDSCATALLTANFSGGVPNTAEWYRDGILQQIRGKRNPNASIVAGVGTTDAGKLHGPRDVAVDKDGNIYVVDDGSQRVQKWAPGATEGVTVAGGNGKGSNLNQFFTPQGIAVDKAGNVFVSDDLMARVTKWAPGATEGVVVAGGHGEGSAANQLNGPQNIFLDTAGNIYIADRWNHRVQKWAPGAITGVTVAGGNGSGSAANQLSEPMDVVADKFGNVYVVDYFNNRVQKWAPGSITGVTVAGGNGVGSSASQFNFTTALSITPDGSLYVRDQNNYRIQKWTAGATAGITVAGGNGTGANPENEVGPGFGLFADKFENIYVPELFQNIVNKFIPAANTDMQYTATLPASYSVVIRGENGCNAQSTPYNVITTPAQPSVITGPTVVSPGQRGIIYRVKKVKGVTYTWTVPADATIMAGQGYWGIKVKWGFSSGRVTVTAGNACGISPARQKRVDIGQPGAVAADNAVVVKDTRISMYPNPAISNTTVLFSSDKSTTFTLELTDVSGKILLKKDGFAFPGENRINIAVSNFNAGIYFIHIIDNVNGRRSISFVKE